VTDPYRLDTPAVVSFSGGRTSGYMLWHVLRAFGGTLPDGVKVVFCNTGKERPETLDFVERCSQRWGVPVVWLEYRYEQDGTPGKVRREGHTRPGGRAAFVVVDYLSASRNGEPLEAVISARNLLPNPVMRFCTVETKIRTTDRFVRSLGWTDWTNAIGLRADEPQRVAKMRANNKRANPREDPTFPLHRAGVTNADVMAFWAAQPFDLQLKSHEGNCDLCFLKGAGKLLDILRDRPDLADWWVRMETKIAHSAGGTGRFRRDRPGYAALLEKSQRPGLFDTTEDDELSAACHCTD
jgi:3'-phosphoadenosine 5'-phosphosulfate sulfotransferase (PAPS reductase)/FAD synthetase